MSNTIFPLSNTNLNNITNNFQNLKGQSYSTGKTNDNNCDTFIRRNKKKIICFAIGTTIASIGFVLLAKSGKLGKKCREFVNNLFHFSQKTTPETATNKTLEIQVPTKTQEIIPPAETLTKPAAEQEQKLSIIQKGNSEISQTVEEAKIERGLPHKSTQESTKVFKQTGKSEIEIDKIDDLKKKEIESLKAIIEEERTKFIEEHMATPYEVRREQVAKYCRTSYGNSFANEVYGEKKAVKYDDEYYSYLERIWADTPKAKELTLQLNLQEMNADKMDLFKKAISILDKQHIEYDKCSLSGETVDTLRQIVEGKCNTNYGQVIYHGDAYKINGALRAGFEVNDTERLILDVGFKTVKPLGTQTIVYRSVAGSKEDGSIEFINNLVNAKKGYVFSDKGYAYSSYNPDCAVACNSSTQATGSPEIRLNIVVPKGARVSNGMGYEQQEMLFPRNAQFRVLEEATDPRPEDKRIGNYLEMTVEYILPKE